MRRAPRRAAFGAAARTAAMVPDRVDSLVMAAPKGRKSLTMV